MTKHEMLLHRKVSDKMKKWLMIIICLLTAISTAAVYLHQKDATGEIEEDGGRINHNNPKAPKLIESTEITQFSCFFSVLDLLERGELGSFDYYTMKAKLADGIVEGYYYPAYHHGSKDRAFEFKAEPSFMEQLQRIISEYNLSQYNGMDSYVSALPDRYGADLSVHYASGERLTAFDNQDNFLSMDAMCALKKLFDAQIVK